MANLIAPQATTSITIDLGQGPSLKFVKDPAQNRRLLPLIMSNGFRAIHIDLHALTREEISLGTVALRTQTVFEETASVRSYDISAQLGQIRQQTLNSLTRANAACVLQTDSSLLTVMQRELLKEYKGALADYMATHERLKQTLPLLPESLPKPASADFAALYQTDAPPRTIVLKGKALPPAAPQRKKPCEAITKLFIKSAPQPLMQARSIGIPIHEAVLHADHAGPVLKKIISNPSLEQREGEIQFAETPIDVVDELVRFLYFKQIKVPSDDHAQALYQLADQFDMEDLKPFCETGARRKDLIDANPAQLPTVDDVRVELAKSSTPDEAVVSVQKAIDRIRFLKEFFLDRHMKAITG
jgi:hypothetical protein